MALSRDALSKELIAQVLRLSASQRAELAQRLLASLHEEDDQDQDPCAAEAWAAEIEKRAQQVLCGDVEMVDGRDVLRRASERLRSHAR